MSALQFNSTGAQLAQAQFLFRRAAECWSSAQMSDMLAIEPLAGRRRMLASFNGEQLQLH